jgi:hypothetical protein
VDLQFAEWLTNKICNSQINQKKFADSHISEICGFELRIFLAFLNKFETALMGYSGAWGELIHEKNLKSKISWHCPFKLPFACKKLYKVKTAAQCHSLSTGNYIP